jgi:hypothetical protein
MSQAAMGDTAARHFAPSYQAARAQFLAAAAAAGLPVTSHPHPLPGRDGEALAIDVVRAGPDDAAAVLLVSSACHGVEGFCGSGVQHALLEDAGLLADAAARGVAVVLVHALNPYGFSWWRRTTHENVDLNRNFQDFSQPLPANPAYDAVADLVVPATWPAEPAVQARIDALIAERGMAWWQATVSGGQHSHPDGLFYGGHAPTWSQATLRQVLRTHGQRCAQLGWIDLHTGLGPRGVGERIFACRDDAAALARAKAWWGPAITSIYDGSSTSARLTGLMWLAAYQECAQAAYTGIALEYGTLPIGEMLNALRADQWLANHAAQASPAQAGAIKQGTRDAFYIDAPDWQQQIVDQGLTAARQAVAGLAAG